MKATVSLNYCRETGLLSLRIATVSVNLLHSQCARRVVCLRSCSLFVFVLVYEEEHQGLIFAEACHAKSWA